jgi:hypothetical protein
LLGNTIAKSAPRSGGNDKKSDARHARQVAGCAPQGQRIPLNLLASIGQRCLEYSHKFECLIYRHI